MKLRMLAVLALIMVPFLSFSALASSHTPVANAASKGLQKQVSGKFTASTGSLKGPGTFTGTLHVQHFKMQGHHLMAQVTVSGTLKDASGQTKDASQTLIVPVQSLRSGGGHSLQVLSVGNNSHPMQTAGSCNILTLNLGAIHLNLLGLVVNLAPVNLTITGQTGPGNLLGNLLCGVAGLLNGLNLNGLLATLLGDITMILNQVLTGL